MGVDIWRAEIQFERMIESPVLIVLGLAIIITIGLGIYFAVRLLKDNKIT